MNARRSRGKKEFSRCPVWSTVGEHYDWERGTREQDENYVLHGRYDNLPQSHLKVVRIFLSSTFTDTYCERNLLIQNVYPKLKKRAREKYGLDFQVVDMRWGVRDEATVDHSTSSLCMNEIANSKKLSIGPTFIALLSHRYGGRFLPTIISAVEMDAILNSLRELDIDKDDIELVEKWFKLDTNAIPAEYCLMSIINNDEVEVFLKEQDVVVEKYKRGLNAMVYEEDLKEDTDDVTAKKKDSRSKYAELLNDGKRQWRMDEPRLVNILRKGVITCTKKGTVTEEETWKYFRSITEEEIRRGIFQEANATDRCLVFIRNIENINLEHKKAWRFIDLNNDIVDEDAQMLLKKLKETTIPHSLPKENILTLSTNWSDNDGINETDNAIYLKQFCEAFENTVWQLIERNVAKSQFSAERVLYLEILEHSYHCIQKAETFYGRQDVLENIKSYILSTSVQPLVLYGESGAGKTSIMAKTAMKISSWLGNGKNIGTILRFCGTTPDSSNILDFLANIAEQIVEVTGLKPRYKKLPVDISDMQEIFEEILDAIPTDKKVIIIADSLDQLSENENTQNLMWLPRKLPSQVKMVVSLIGDDYSVKRTMNSKRPRLDENQFVEVESLDSSTGQTVLDMWLKGANRCLNLNQERVVQSLMKSKVSPLYVKLVFDEARRWKSFDNFEFDCSTVPSCLQRLYRRLETKHGAVIISKAFGYLTACKNGLTEQEMEDILSLDDDVLTDVFQFHVPPVRRLPSILWSRIRSDMHEYIVDRGADGVRVMSWYHRQFLQEARKRYLPMKTTQFSLNVKPLTTTKNYRLFKTLAEYFAGVWANDKMKPFTYTKFQCKRLGLSKPESSAVRYVSEQPTIYGSSVTVANKKELQYNRRKLSELPPACLTVLKHEDITPFVAEHLALNQLFLAAWISTTRWEEMSNFFKEIIEEHQHVQSYSMWKQVKKLLSPGFTRHEDEKGQLKEIMNVSSFGKVLQISAVYHCLLLCYPKIQQNPSMLGTDITGRLLPFNTVADKITEWIQYTDGPGRNTCALVPPHLQLGTPGDALQYIIDVHEGPIQDFKSYKASISHYVMSTSRKFVLVSLEDGRIWIDATPATMPKGESFHKVVMGKQLRSLVFFVSLQYKPVVYMYSSGGKELCALDMTSHVGSEVEISDLKVIDEDDTSTLLVTDYRRHNVFIVSNFGQTPLKPVCNVLPCEGIQESKTEKGDKTASNRIVQIIVHPDKDKILVVKDFGCMEMYNLERDMLATRSFEWSSIKLVDHVLGLYGEVTVAICFENGQFCLMRWDSTKESLKHLQPKYLLSQEKLKHNISYGIPHHIIATAIKDDRRDVVVLACTNKYLIAFTCGQQSNVSSSSSDEEGESPKQVMSDGSERLKLLFRIKQTYTVATISKYMKHLFASRGDNIHIFNILKAEQEQDVLGVRYLASVSVGQNITAIVINVMGGTDMNFTAVCQNSQMLFYDLTKLGILDEYIPKFHNSESDITEICASEDTAITFSNGSGSVHQWDIMQGTIARTLRHPNQQSFLKLTADELQENVILLDSNGSIFLSQGEKSEMSSYPPKCQTIMKKDKVLRQSPKPCVPNFVIVSHFQTSLTHIEDCEADDIFLLLLPNNIVVLATTRHSVPLILTFSKIWTEFKLKEIKGPLKNVCQLQDHTVLFMSNEKCYVYDTMAKCITQQFLLCDVHSSFTNGPCSFMYTEHTSELWMATGHVLSSLNPAKVDAAIPIELLEFERDLPCKLYRYDEKQIIVLQCHKCSFVDIITKQVTNTLTFGKTDVPIDHCMVTKDGQYIVFVTQGKEVYLHRSTDGKLLAWYTIYESVKSLGVSTNSWCVLLGTSDKRLFVMIIADPDVPSHSIRIDKARQLNPSLSCDKALIAIGILNNLHFSSEELSDEDIIRTRTAHMKKYSVNITMGSDCSSDEESDEYDSSQQLTEKVYSLVPCTLQ